MIRVAALTDDFDPSARNGGISSVLAMLQSHWNKDPRVTMDIWTLRGSHSNCLNVPPVPMAGIIGSFRFGLLGLARSYDIVFPQHAEMSFIPGASRTVCFAHTVTSMEHHQKPKWWQSVVRFTERNALKGAHRILCLNPDIRIELVNCYKAAEQKIRIVTNGIDAEWWATGSEKVDRQGLMFVGRLIHRKQLDFAIQVVSRLGAMDCFPRLTIIGDGLERSTMENLARTLLRPNQYVFAGWMDQSTLRKNLHSADCLIFPSKSEGLPLSVVEAAAAGAIPIFGRNGSESIFNSNPPVGVYVDSWNVDDWAHAIHSLLESSKKRSELREASRSAVFERFSSGAAANGVLQNLMEVFRDTTKR
jgi:glycosyltransferase involved in cell wall biosynthesis